jgi:peptidoglycan/xylan/chitin deacetylase (PgdA/CDA1 family)
MKQIVKYIIHDLLFSVAVALKVDLLLRRLSANKHLILMYHGVSETNLFSVNGRHITKAQFEKQLIYFKRNFEVVSLEDICERRKKCKVRKGKRYIALTFDDGFLNNYKVALPLLEKHLIPATFFISGANIDNSEYIHPSDLMDVLRVSLGSSIEINERIFIPGKHRLIEAKTGLSAYTYWDTLPYPEWVNALRTIKKECSFSVTTNKVNQEVFKLVGKEELKKLSESKYASVGSHAFEHVNLTMLSASELHYQLEASKKTLEQVTGKPVTSLAFPNGRFNEQVVLGALKIGYKYLIAAGSVNSCDSELVIPRIGILSGASCAYNILLINKGFKRFGF